MKYNIKSKQPQGFWRAGHFWSATETIVDKSEFTDEQWEQLRQEAMLSVHAEAPVVPALGPSNSNVSVVTDANITPAPPPAPKTKKTKAKNK